MDGFRIQPLAVEVVIAVAAIYLQTPALDVLYHKGTVSFAVFIIRAGIIVLYIIN